MDLFDDTPITWLENKHVNTQAASAAVNHLLPDGITHEARAFHAQMPGFEMTPLKRLNQLASRFGLGGIWVKDEAARMRLNAFKALGGSFAIYRFICQKVGRPRPVSYTHLDVYKRQILTFVCIGLLGFPIMLLLALGLVLGSLLGWVVVGTWLGVRLFGHGKDERIVRAAALGTGALTLLFGVLGLIPFVFGESLLVFVLVSIGLGAVALTQFGMKPYPRRPRANTPSGPEADKVDIVLGTLPPEERPA